MITINIEKAKEITKERLREEREPLLNALDVQYMRALENGTSTEEILVEKNRLRDITNLADMAETVNDLKSIKIAVE